MVKISIKVRINSRFKRADGTSALYLQILMNRKKWDAPLNLHWKANKFSIEDPYCLKQSKNDVDYNDFNIIIRKQVSKANEIVKYYRLSDTELTMEKFKEEYNNENAKRDFINYYEFKMNQRKKKKIITERTYASHKTTLSRLKELHEELLFANITNDFAIDFETFLRNNHKNSANTIHGRQKTVKSYMNMALRDNIFFTNPYKNYQLKKMKGNWKSLSRKDLKVLYKIYLKMDDNLLKKNVLRRFLFSCFTGLRLSDMKNLSNSHITEDYLIIDVYKTRKSNKVLHLPLSEKAKFLLNEEKKAGELNNLFNKTSDQYSNRILSSIGEDLGFMIKLQHHIGRETFATLYLEGGGSIEMLKEYLGHADIQTTMKYVHISEERKLSEINLIDRMI